MGQQIAEKHIKQHHPQKVCFKEKISKKYTNTKTNAQKLGICILRFAITDPIAI